MKGQGLTLNTVAMIALALIAVVIITLIFRQFVTRSGAQLGNITEETRIQQDVCTNYILQRACQQDRSSCTEGTRQVYSPVGEFKDCPRTGEDSGVCCEAT